MFVNNYRVSLSEHDYVSCHYVSEFAGCFYPNVPIFLNTLAIVNMLIYVARLVVFLVLSTFKNIGTVGDKAKMYIISLVGPVISLPRV